MYRLTLPAPDCVTEKLGRKAANHWMVCESMTDFAALPRVPKEADDWLGGNEADAVRMAHDGDMSQVAASDAYLEKLEANMILSGRKAWIDDVAGAVPNVGAFLSGSPCAMRYRKKTSDDSAPIGVVYDGTVSGGVSVETMRNRGTIALALVRLLSARRPVELWFIVGTEAGRAREDAGFIATRIDTSPLDLARAGFALAHPAATRRLGYQAARHEKGFQAGSSGSLSWPYGPGEDSLPQESTRQCFAEAFPHLSDVLVVPGLHLTDPVLKDPEGWLRSQVSKYTSNEEN